MIVFVTIAAVVGVARVMAVRIVAMLMRAPGPVLMPVGVGVAVHMGVRVAMRGAVGVGVLMFVRMLMVVLVVVVMHILAAVGVLVGHAILAEITTAGLAHYPSPLAERFPSLYNPTVIIFETKTIPANKINPVYTARYK